MLQIGQGELDLVEDDQQDCVGDVDAVARTRMKEREDEYDGGHQMESVAEGPVRRVARSAERPPPGEVELDEEPDHEEGHDDEPDPLHQRGPSRGRVGIVSWSGVRHARLRWVDPRIDQCPREESSLRHPVEEGWHEPAVPAEMWNRLLTGCSDSLKGPPFADGADLGGR